MRALLAYRFCPVCLNLGEAKETVNPVEKSVDNP